MVEFKLETRQGFFFTVFHPAKGRFVWDGKESKVIGRYVSHEERKACPNGRNKAIAITLSEISEEEKRGLTLFFNNNKSAFQSID